MTKQEEQDFLNIIDLENENHYDILGLTPFSKFKNENYNERIKYLNAEILDPKIKNEGFKRLNLAKVTLNNTKRKSLYDSKLKKLLKYKLITLIEFAVTLDKTLTSSERRQLENFGRHFGLTFVEINDIIEGQRQIHNFCEIS